MDPDATLKLITSALRDGDREEAMELKNDLLGWLRGGGFKPNWDAQPIAAKYVRGQMNVGQAIRASGYRSMALDDNGRGHDPQAAPGGARNESLAASHARRAHVKMGLHEIDHTGGTELALTIENDGDLYRRRTLPIIKNLAKKMAKGSYNAALAQKLWMYLANDGAAKYKKEYGVSFNVPTRQFVAAKLQQNYEEEVREAANELPKKLSTGHKARARKQTQLAKEQERYAMAKRRAHEKEQAKLEKAIGAIERRFNPKIAKLENDIRKHEETAAHHHAEAHKHD